MDYKKISDIFHTLSNVNRLRLLVYISKEDRTMSDLCEYMAISRPAIINHLNVLISENLIEEVLTKSSRMYKQYKITELGERITSDIKMIEKELEKKKEEESNDLFLIVKPALDRDVGKGIARINKLGRSFLKVKIGDEIELKIEGRSIYLPVARAYDTDSDKWIVRIEKKYRDMLGIRCGEKVIVRKRKI
ncbi:MAG: hypothetical protein B5M53_07445 [Candidatus Cloacimonas sp. 4484_209]|nr:MAG: hypothetical protein B5M53_07445 [Candidatus Cloacimonas sp. 4484_209]